MTFVDLYTRIVDTQGAVDLRYGLLFVIAVLSALFLIIQIAALIMGLTLAWLASVDWSDLPTRIAGWFRLQRRRLFLVTLGGIFASILLLF